MPPLHPGNVLIVEDDPDIRKMLAALLNTAGFHAVPAEDGLEALHLLRAVRHRAPEAPCLILLDLKMPRIGGFEFLEWRSTQAHEDLRIIPVIVMSGSALEEDVKRAYQLGANQYMVKPIDWDSFRERMRLLGTVWKEHCETPKV